MSVPGVPGPSNIAADLAQQVVQELVLTLEPRIAALEKSAGVSAQAAMPQVIAAAASAGNAALGSVAHDQTTQRGVVWGVTATALLASLGVLASYLNGNGPAGHIVGGVPAVVGALVLWVSDSRGGTSRRPALPSAPGK